MEYTAIGDTTNTASRLEGLTKGSGHMIFISETTRERMRSTQKLIPVGEFEIRGRTSKLAVWTIAPSDASPGVAEAAAGSADAPPAGIEALR
jgi:adenylate cyclase